MDLYEEMKKDLGEVHLTVMEMWKSSLGNENLLLTMISVSVLLFGTMSVLNFCYGGWYIVLGIYYLILLVLMVVLGVRSVHRIKEVKEQIKANDMWYESELNRLNNLIKESENGTDKTNR